MKTLNMHYVTPLVAAIALAHSVPANAQLGLGLGGSVGLSASSSLGGSIGGIGANSSLSSGLSATSSLDLNSGMSAVDSVINQLEQSSSIDGSANGSLTLEGLGDSAINADTNGVVEAVSGQTASVRLPGLGDTASIQSQVNAAVDAALAAQNGAKSPSSPEPATTEPDSNEPSEDQENVDQPQASDNRAAGDVVASLRSATEGRGSAAAPGSVSGQIETATQSASRATAELNGNPDAPSGAVSLNSVTELTSAVSGNVSGPNDLAAAIEAAISSSFGSTLDAGNAPRQPEPESDSTAAEDAVDDAPSESESEQPSGNAVAANLESASEQVASVKAPQAGSFEGTAYTLTQANGSVEGFSQPEAPQLDITSQFMAMIEGHGDVSGAISGSEIGAVMLNADYASALQSESDITSSAESVSAASQSSADLASSANADVQQ